MSEMPVCPECASEFTYEMGNLLVCSLCAHEWSAIAGAVDDDSGFGLPDAPVIKDSVGNPLADGDTVTIVKTLKVKGNPSDIKVGTKVRNIRLVYGSGDHDIDCKVDGFGPMMLKSSVVKKV
jgi:protein PhnA